MKEEHFVYAMVGITGMCALSLSSLLVIFLAFSEMPIQYFTSPLLLITGVAIFAMGAVESQFDGASMKQSLWNGVCDAMFVFGMGIAALVIAFGDAYGLSKVWVLGVVVFGSLFAIHISYGIVKLARTVQSFT